MTLLLIDVGNTRIKWARLVAGRLGKLRAAAHVGWDADDYARRVIGRIWHAGAKTTARARLRGARSELEETADALAADRIVISSVAGAEVKRRLMAAARKAGAPRPEFVAAQRGAAGVTTSYIEPWRLGVDRFVGAIGAHHLASGKPVCVVNVGTAITIDLVDQRGRHLGGAIVPGPALMVDSLLTQTSGIRRRAQGGPGGAINLFARTTRTAITQGARYAAAAVIDRAIEEAREQLGSCPLVLLTGGASAVVKPLMLNSSVTIPELVLHGLAVWARAAKVSRKRRGVI